MSNDNKIIKFPRFPDLTSEQLLQPSALDITNSDTHHSSMSDVSRPEFDAKLDAIQSRMDARVASIESKIDLSLSKMDMREQNAEIRASASKMQFDVLDQKVTSISGDVHAARQDSKNLKFWLIGTALATIVGLAALNATIFSNMVASFESGKNTTQLVLDSKKQAEETALLLKDVKAQVDALKNPNLAAPKVAQ